MESLEQQFKEVHKLHIFELELITNGKEPEYFTFDIEIHKGTATASGEPVSVCIDTDEDESLDYNLQKLYSELIEELAENEYYIND